MGLGDSYIFKKEIDWSSLHQGLSIPVNIQVNFRLSVGRFLKRGEKREIKLILDGQTYPVQLINQKFDEKKYGNRKDIIQIRYNPASELACRMRAIYKSTYDKLSLLRENKIDGKKLFCKVDEAEKEYLVLYTTEFEDTFILETIVNDEIRIIKDLLKPESERVFENIINYNLQDKNATILFDSRLVKIRRLNRAIGENLKLLYKHKCQICGENVAKKYDASIAEAHHIQYFVNSLNNDASNLLILCPNHHSIIHDVEPEFLWDTKGYIFKNGLIESIKLNYHL